jgi:hypothetical protein
MDYQRLLDALEELYDEYAGFSKERKWGELRDDINALKEWMLMGMEDDCPIEPENWLNEEQLAELDT